MTTSVAIVENGKIAFEPTEITYRTIFYYLDASMAKMLQPNSGSAIGPAKTDQPKPSNSSATESRVAAPLAPRMSLNKLQSSTVQPPSGEVASIVDTNKSVLPADSEPPPPPRTILKPMSGGVLNGNALSLPAPLYPETAKRMHAAGKVEVEVVVDENGKVISARAISGPTLLRDASVAAASRARFTPTKLSGQPIKVVGKIFYNFIAP
jgi:protein TonB